MKKIVSVALLSLLTLALCACGDKKGSIEDYKWKMEIVQSNDVDEAQNADQSVIAIGEKNDAYPNAPVVELLLTAKDRTISIEDETNNKAYTGTYSKQNSSSDGTIYEVVIDGKSGYATVSVTESDG